MLKNGHAGAAPSLSFFLTTSGLVEHTCVCVCVCVCTHVFVWLGLFLCTLIRYMGFYGYSFFMLSWMFRHDHLDTYYFECLMHVFCIFVFALFSTIEHVSHGKAL